MFRPGPRLLPFIIVVLTYFPFLNQAYHIDDRIYLQIAENILEQPLYPYDFDALFEGFIAPDAASHSHLPLTSYYLAVIQIINPDMDEWIAHLAFLVFPLLAVYGFAGIAKRSLRHPHRATVLFTLSTSFLVLSHTLMPDVPFVAFWLVSMRHYFVIISDDTPKTRDYWICGAALLGASFLSLLSFGLILLYLIYPLFKKYAHEEDQIPWRNILFLVSLPFLLWAIWYFRGYLHYDRFVLTNTLGHMQQRSFLSLNLIISKTLSLVNNIGATFSFPLLAWITFGTRRTIPAFLGILGISSLGLSWVNNWHWVHSLLFGTFFSTGLLSLYGLLGMGYGWALPLLKKLPKVRQIESSGKRKTGSINSRDAETGILLLWAAGIFFACIVVFYSGSVRYSFLAMPPVLILILRQLETQMTRIEILSKTLSAMIVLTFGYSLAVSYGDFLFAETYRRSAAEICTEFADSDRQIFFTGEWGFRYYMKKNGARPISKTSLEAAPGDLLVKPYVALPWTTLYDGDHYSRLLQQRVVQLAYPVRILDFASRAGFYSTGWGPLPVSLAVEEKWEWFNVYEITRQYDGEIPEEEIPY